MRKGILFFIIIFVLQLEVLAEEPVYLAIENTLPELNLNVQEDILKSNSIQNTEDFQEKSFIEKIMVDDALIKAEANYDVLNYQNTLFSAYTTQNDFGIFETMKPFVAYQGYFTEIIPNDGSANTLYRQPTLDLGITGKFKEVPVEYKFLFNMFPAKNLNFFQSMLQDDFIIFKGIPKNDIYLGSFRTPIGVEGGTSGYSIPFMFRSQLARNFGSIRALGFKVVGDYDLFDYNLGMTTSDRHLQKFMSGVEFNGQFSLKPLGKTKGEYGELVLGGGLNAGHNDINYCVTTAHAKYKYKRFSVDAEYGISNGSNGLTGLVENKADGVVVTMGYFLTKKLQLLARYDTFNYDRHSNIRSTDYTAGLTYYIKGSALKFILNYIYHTSNFEKSSNKILLGTQIML